MIKTIEVMEYERKTLSKEIHDSIGGTLCTIYLQLEAQMSRMDLAAQGSSSGLMSFENIVMHLKNAIGEIKRISRQLHSLTLDDFGFKPAIQEHTRHFRQFYPGIKVITHFDIENEDIPDGILTVLYRVIREALDNAGRHSGATQVSVEFTKQQNQLRLKAADNGCGFDIEKVLDGKESVTGYGIRSMRELVEICKGEFQICSEPGAGTVINISIPL